MKQLLIGERALPKPELLTVNGLPLPPYSWEKPKYPKEEILFVLGVADAEMNRIEEILIDQEYTFIHAHKGGARVNLDNAYKADSIDTEENKLLMKNKKLVIFVECDVPSYLGERRKIDHHNPGDVGYTFSPEQFWEGSSIGQLYSFLGMSVPTKGDLIIAARDHCEFDAALGKCPGITKEDIQSWCIASFAKETGNHEDKVAKMLASMKTMIASSPIVTIGDQEVIDLRHTPTGVGYTLEYLTARESLIDLGLPGLIQCKNHKDGFDKIIMCGALQSAVNDFIGKEGWGKRENLHDYFFVPARRYVGGFKLK